MSCPANLAEPGIKWTSDQIYDGLKAMFSPPSYALLFEVPDGTGSQKSRSADALAMSLWPSRGLHLTGFEIKASRTDWVRELNNPAKAEALARYCDRWYLVVGAREIVQVGELPPNWGLIAPKGGKLKVVVEAALLTPAPVDRAFLAALFRRTVEKIEREDEVRVAREEGRKEGFESGRKSAESTAAFEAKRYRESFEALRQTVDDFQAASGLTISTYNGAKMGEAVRLFMHGGLSVARLEMDAIERAAGRVMESARKFRQEAANLTKEPTTP